MKDVGTKPPDSLFPMCPTALMTTMRPVLELYLLQDDDLVTVTSVKMVSSRLRQPRSYLTVRYPVERVGEWNRWQAILDTQLFFLMRKSDTTTVNMRPTCIRLCLCRRASFSTRWLSSEDDCFKKYTWFMRPANPVPHVLFTHPGDASSFEAAAAGID